MLTQSLLTGIRTLRVEARRSIGILAPALNKAASDPIQALFLQKVQEYKGKSKDGKFVEPTPEIEKELKNELDRVSKQFGGGEGVDMTKFPEFKFEEPKIDPISASAN